MVEQSGVVTFIIRVKVSIVLCLTAECHIGDYCWLSQLKEVTGLDH